MATDPVGGAGTDRFEVPETEGAEDAPLYSSAYEWATEWLLPTYRRHPSGARVWCPQWWKHAEAVYRIQALWRGFEEVRLQPGAAVSAWVRDHLDYHMNVLMEQNGPFIRCSSKDGHRTDQPEVLHTDPAPEQLRLLI